ncbi:DUF4192 domain-containing protein [Actinocatenispora comari]|uniref:DUF4192 domain-containing protein n=1 Tax=Actinocatenispora comari TaxID=2807577 RepID=A0A8J4A791_9ACTN|nr:DUF4192 domain-containing protein [Actinocatenispora comari]GIL25485.1 hypothetical protein NUM_07400 [Actinocatenispora comari]
MTDHDRQRPQPVRLSTPDALLTAIPYLLGYHPCERLVALLLKDNHVELILSYQLDTPDIATHLVECARRHHASAVALALFSDLDSATTLLRWTAHAARAAGIRPLGQLQIQNGRYQVLDPHDGEDCGWQHFGPDTAIQATMVTHGLVAHAHRADLDTQFTAVTGAARDAIRHTTMVINQRWQHRSRRDADKTRHALRAIGQRYLATIDRQVCADPTRTITLPDNHVAQLGICLRDVAVRDAAIEYLDTNLAAYQRLWAQMMRRVDHDDLPACATICAYAFWRNGDWLNARFAITHALDADPNYRLAQLLRTALDAQIPPDDRALKPAHATPHSPER